MLVVAWRYDLDEILKEKPQKLKANLPHVSWASDKFLQGV